MALADKALLRVLAGEAMNPPPIWLMRQAGRYLPEYREVRAQAGSFLDLCYDSKLAAEVTLQPIRRFGFDAAIIFADILLVPHALGVDVRFVEGEGPRLAPIKDRRGLEKLLERPDGKLDAVYETIRRVRGALDSRTALIGFSGAPWTVATYMIAGQGTPDQAEAKLLAYRDTGFMDALIERLCGATIHYLGAQIEAGAEVIQLFDTWAGGLSAPLLDRYVFAPTAHIVRALKAKFPQVPIIGFARGIGTHMPRYAAATGVDGIGIATGDDAQLVADLLAPGIAAQGGLDPLALIAGGDALAHGVRSLNKAIGTRPFIFNLGHGILPQTPPEHVAELVRMVRVLATS